MSPALDVFGSGEVFHGESVGAEEGPTAAGSVGTSEGLTVGTSEGLTVGTSEGLNSETSEGAEDRYTLVSEAVLVKMTVDKEGKTVLWSPVPLMKSSAGVGAKDREDSVSTSVE